MPAEGAQALDVRQGEVFHSGHCVALLQAQLVTQALQGAVALRCKVLPYRLILWSLSGHSRALCSRRLRRRFLPLSPVYILYIVRTSTTSHMSGACAAQVSTLSQLQECLESRAASECSRRTVEGNFSQTLRGSTAGNLAAGLGILLLFIFSISPSGSILGLTLHFIALDL